MLAFITAYLIAEKFFSLSLLLWIILVLIIPHKYFPKYLDWWII